MYTYIDIRLSKNITKNGKNDADTSKLLVTVQLNIHNKLSHECDLHKSGRKYILLA